MSLIQAVRSDEQIGKRWQFCLLYKWRANEQLGRGWAPTRYKTSYLYDFWLYIYFDAWKGKAAQICTEFVVS